MYTAIQLDKENFEGYASIIKRKEDEINNLNRINIFIGPNNSGKSRFLRTIFNHKDLSCLDNNFNILRYQWLIEHFHKSINNLFIEYRLGDIHEYNSSKIINTNWLNKTTIEEIASSISYLKELVNTRLLNFRGENNTPFYEGNQFIGEFKSIVESTVMRLPFDTKAINAYKEELSSYECIYIPTIRGLRGTNYSISEEKDAKGQTSKRKTESKEYDNYEHRTRADYFKTGLKEKATIYTGFHLYTDVRKLLLGKNQDREKIRSFEKFIGDTFFGGKPFNIIPSVDDHSVHISIDNEEDKPIYDLGDGIQSIIILTYPLFFNTDKKMKVFYEEPDLYLHPGYQRIFMEAIARPEFKDFQFFFTTHSNHFLDMTLDYSNISVYAFRRIADKQFEIENVENANMDVLQQLGVRNSSVFLTNCTIWVEGISDRIYLRKILELIFKDKVDEKLGKEYLEDVHYSFVEYGGNNITHWSFLDSEDEHSNIDVKRLCGKLFLITDSDDAKPKKDKTPSKKMLRQAALKEKLTDERYFCLNGREIENLLTPDTILKTVIAMEKPKTTEGIVLKPKAILKEKDRIGSFIEKNITGKSNSYASESGSIKSKAEFAKNAVGVISKLDDFTGEARLLAEKLYQFIYNNNN